MRLAIALVLALFPLRALAQDMQLTRASDDCHTMLRTGSGVTYTKVCISSTGNVTSYESPAGVEHIRVRDPLEGYRVCRADDWSPLWDSGVDDAGAQETIIHQPNGANTLPLRITRIGFGGLKLVQDFSFTTRAYGPAELTVQMKVYNTGQVTLPHVMVQRFFDADINGTLPNHAFVRASTAAVLIPGGDGRVQPGARGLSLSAGILDKPHWANEGLYESLLLYIESGEPSDCNAGAVEFGGSAQPSDKLGVVTYGVGDILPGRVKTVSFIYRRF